MDIIKACQERCAPDVFTPPGSYDGRKNFFAARRLPLGPEDTREFDVTLETEEDAARNRSQGGKGPKIYKVKFKLVANINPEVLQRFIQGQQSQDNMVLTAITALNVVIRMAPSMRYPFNVRSFYTDQEKKDIGSGLELWRGYFQSIRPAFGRMLINVDISTATMYKPGPLIGLALDFFGRSNPNDLAPARGLPDRERLRLQRFITGIRVLTPTPDGRQITRIIKKLSPAGAGALSFKLKEGGSMTVADYFKNVIRSPLKYPEVLCVEIGTGALIPFELCTVPPGQIMRKQVPPEKTKSVLDFATKQPADRLASITAGLNVLAYGQSEYVRNFGISLTIVPANGQWNMREKCFFKPVEIPRWVLVSYETTRRFSQQAATQMMQALCESAREVGIKMQPTPIVVLGENGQGNISAQLKAAGKLVVDKYGKGPSLLVIILPEGGNETYTASKHFGDIVMGVATQCLKSSKCVHAKPQYFANVCLKINVKLGGINTVPDANSVRTLSDPQNPTIVMGADVIHPAPGSDGRPSFTALVASVDSDNAKYVADCAVQTSRQEIIEDLETMAKVCC
ncbi:hypothetical protein BDP27DRAFT_1332495 [Rhodocollybia butyracea]|uniref:Piwi domain-containing protein n=1 Tax=Rhodocollybia butyracea TaxID=206335 RepID=A0A9P5PKU2_9AGAR|nr:hypothetical protein BDP27DRAFT_1332495 [Rhodocollybia butyracea]